MAGQQDTQVTTGQLPPVESALIDQGPGSARRGGACPRFAAGRPHFGCCHRPSRRVTGHLQVPESEYGRTVPQLICPFAVEPCEELIRGGCVEVPLQGNEPRVQ
jgi:hypothetical protein